MLDLTDSKDRTAHIYLRLTISRPEGAGWRSLFCLIFFISLVYIFSVFSSLISVVGGAMLASLVVIAEEVLWEL